MTDEIVEADYTSEVNRMLLCMQILSTVDLDAITSAISSAHAGQFIVRNRKAAKGSMKRAALVAATVVSLADPPTRTGC